MKMYRMKIHIVPTDKLLEGGERKEKGDYPFFTLALVELWPYYTI